MNIKIHSMEIKGIAHSVELTKEYKSPSVLFEPILQQSRVPLPLLSVCVLTQNGDEAIRSQHSSCNSAEILCERFLSHKNGNFVDCLFVFELVPP